MPCSICYSAIWVGPKEHNGITALHLEYKIPGLKSSILYKGQFVRHKQNLHGFVNIILTALKSTCGVTDFQNNRCKSAQHNTQHRSTDILYRNPDSVKICYGCRLHYKQKLRKYTMPKIADICCCMSKNSFRDQRASAKVFFRLKSAGNAT